MSDIISKTAFAKHVKQIAVPKGFTASMGTEPMMYDKKKDAVYILKSETIEIKFHQMGSGETLYLHKDKWYTFDRHGVEASFYHLPLYKGDTDVYDLNEIVREQIERVAEQLKVQKRLMPVPGIPFSVTPERLVALKAQLNKKNGSASFMPSGFGTGYTLSKRGDRYSRRAKAETETFFGVAPLYVSTFDAD